MLAYDSELTTLQTAAAAANSITSKHISRRQPARLHPNTKSSHRHHRSFVTHV